MSSDSKSDHPSFDEPQDTSNTTADTAAESAVADSDISGSEENNAPPPLPSDAAGWRELLAAIPARDLLTLIRKDAPRQARLFAGFRPSPALIRNPVIVSRIVEEVLREPGFAAEVGGIGSPLPPSPSPIGMGEWGTEESETATRLAASALPSFPIPMGEGDGGRGPFLLKQKLKEQRASLREREARIAELESALAQAERDRDTSRATAEAARVSLQKAQEEASRLRRQQERETRRVEKASPVTADAARADAPARRPAAANEPRPAATTAVMPPSLLEEGLRRLLRRGKHTAVADVCREALVGLTEAGSGTGAATVHALYAEALYGLGQDAEAAAQDRRAAVTYLDDAQVITAAESLARALLAAGGANAPASRVTGSGGSTDDSGDIALLRRLFALAQRGGQEEAAVSVFVRLRLTAPPAVYARLLRLLERAGKPLAALLERAAHSASETPRLGTEETVPLPGLPEGITAGGVARAVDSGDAPRILRIRDGMVALRGTNPPLFDALLAAVAATLPAAASLLTAPAPPRPVVVDASNVARYDPDPLALTPTSRVANLLRMRDYLLSRGYFPVLMIADANLRYHVDERAVYEQLIERGVIVETPPRTSADERLIREARERNALIVTNDRLLEWEDAAWGIERRGFGIFPDRISLLNF